MPDDAQLGPGARAQAKAEARRRFGESIKSLWLRVSPDLSQKQIAELAQTGPTTVSDVMEGKRFPKRDLAQRIVGALGADFNEISGLWDELNALQHGASNVSSRVITRFRDNSEFYAAARESILAATRQIRVTYARQYPPDEVSTPEATEYFATMLDWAGRPGARSVERIFGVPTGSPAARRRAIEYLRRHAAELEQRGLRKYEANVFEYTARADLLNMALFDHEVAYIAVSGHHPQNLSGVRVIGGEYTSLLVAHFEQLLPGCQSLTEYLEDLDRVVG